MAKQSFGHSARGGIALSLDQRRRERNGCGLRRDFERLFDPVIHPFVSSSQLRTFDLQALNRWAPGNDRRPTGGAL
jgi:hypothetical protein